MVVGCGPTTLFGGLSVNGLLEAAHRAEDGELIRPRDEKRSLDGADRLADVVSVGHRGEQDVLESLDHVECDPRWHGFSRADSASADGALRAHLGALVRSGRAPRAQVSTPASCG
jgi:hypothetical protein